MKKEKQLHLMYSIFITEVKGKKKNSQRVDTAKLLILDPYRILGKD